MDWRNVRTKAQTLLQIAASQGGYFTAKQALAAGYSYRTQHYHTFVGDWIRLERGIYKLASYPNPEREDLILISLMSLDQQGHPAAVFSHETALVLHGLGDANPERIHLTTPPTFHKRLPPGIVLHRDDIDQRDVEERVGYRVTTPLR